VGKPLLDWLLLIETWLATYSKSSRTGLSTYAWVVVGLIENQNRLFTMKPIQHILVYRLEINAQRCGEHRSTRVSTTVYITVTPSIREDYPLKDRFIESEVAIAGLYCEINYKVSLFCFYSSKVYYLHQ